MRLGLQALGEVTGPRVDPRGLEVGIVHLGLGAFHRAHQAVYTEDAMAAEPGPWGICGASRRNRGVVDALTEQDGLYGVLERGPDEDRVRVLGAVREALVAFLYSRETKGVDMEEIDPTQNELVSDASPTEARELAMNR